MGSPQFSTLLGRILNGRVDNLNRPAVEPSQNAGRAHPWLTADVLRKNIERAKIAKREGMLVFMDGETVRGFAKLFGVMKLARSTMRHLLEEIAGGRIKLESVLPIQSDAATSPVKTPTAYTAPPYTLRQAAALLNTNANALYYRCTLKRIAHFREGSRYLIPEVEVRRLQTCGIK